MPNYVGERFLELAFSDLSFGAQNEIVQMIAAKVCPSHLNTEKREACEEHISGLLHEVDDSVGVIDVFELAESSGVKR